MVVDQGVHGALNDVSIACEASLPYALCPGSAARCAHNSVDQGILCTHIFMY